MITALPIVTANRVWFVPEFNIWGTAGWGEFDLMAVENVNGTNSILFDSISVGETAQEVMFADLTDFRGNSLPETIKNPRIIVRPRGEATGFIVGEETPRQFKIACPPDSLQPVTVDLLIVELGN